jgi:radical SAM family uncharacterized protein
LKSRQNSRATKRGFLKEASLLEGAYVPSLSEVKDGMTVTPVKKAVVRDLNNSPFPEKPLVPNLAIVHDRPVVELFRGCYAGCRFCQAGFYYRPIRARGEEKVLSLAEKLICNTGAEELGLSSLSTGDYPFIEGTLEKLSAAAKKKNVRLQLPSLRLDSFTAKIIGGARKSGLTFAPEAGTQRLRDVINKNITEEDIERTMRLAFSEGYRAVKLYFMVGLPTETDEDLLGIVDIVRKIQKIYFEVTGYKGVNISVSTSVFVPKPATPFQWAEQISVEEMKRRQKLVRDGLKPLRSVSYSWHEEPVSYLEGILSRGGRELSQTIVRAYQKGAVFDGWSEFFRFAVWEEAIKETVGSAEKYTARRDTAERLPWDFIDYGVRRDYLLKEYQNALEGVSSEGCKYGCKGCGANGYVKCEVQKN